MRTVTIYGLVDPRDGIIKYVGKTVQKDPSKRYDQHLYQWKRDKGRHNKVNSWIKCLANLGLKPQQIILELCNESNWQYHERKHIANLRAQGINLKNLTDGGDEPPKNCNSPEAKKKRLETLKTSEAWKQGRISQAQKIREIHELKALRARIEIMLQEARLKVAERKSKKSSD